jgi:death on curing protein
MMTPWPRGEDLLTLLGESTGPHSRVAGGGILVAAAVRPNAVLNDGSTYSTVLAKAAALMHAIMVWEPLDYWNSGLAWAATRAFLERHGLPLTMPAKDRMELTADITARSVQEVDEIASRLAPYLTTR